MRVIYDFPSGCRKCGSVLLAGESQGAGPLHITCAGCGTPTPHMPPDADEPPAEPAPPSQPERQRETDKRFYRLIPHACRACGGRLAKSRPDRRGTVYIRCMECGSTTAGPSGNRLLHKELCACGAKLASGKSDGLRCVRNRRPTLESPLEVSVIKGTPSPPAPPPLRRGQHRRAPDQGDGFPDDDGDA